MDEEKPTIEIQTSKKRGLGMGWDNYWDMFGGVFDDMMNKQDRRADLRDLERSTVSIETMLPKGYMVKIQKRLPDSHIRSFIDSTIENLELLIEAYPDMEKANDDKTKKLKDKICVGCKHAFYKTLMTMCPDCGLPLILVTGGDSE